ncbi:MAG: hypothetical protein NXH91_13135 [Phyllobacteriaceae bacterium]|nr:hypothetical protein [Phyllobacteriaceae bacterium]
MTALVPYGFDIAALAATTIIFALILAVLRSARRPHAVSVDFRKFDALVEEMGSMPRKGDAQTGSAPAE